MNDFTKEELESIANWGEVYTEFGNSWVDKSERPLINKIQSMLDNYCEYKCIHETNSITTSGIIHSCEGDIYKPFKCKKCGEYYDNQ